MSKLKEMYALKIELDININLLIIAFEATTKTKVLMFDSDKKPFKTVLLVDLDEIQL
jgi:hypothetical protein